MRVLVCGSRWWKDVAAIEQRLRALNLGAGDVIIDGHATGADQIAHAFADRNKITSKCFPADWEEYGNAAGPIRNAQMLRVGKPDLVLAFHGNLDGSKGTYDMVKKARKAGIEVRVYES